MGIDARELRIGNIFHAEDEILCMSCDVKIRSISEIEVNWISITKANKGNVQNDNIIDLEPIPLTKEILEKCGFEWYEPLKHYRFVDKEQWYSIKEMKFDNLKEKSLCFSWTNLAWDEGQSMPYVLVKTVHQLQNLFYALHQKELEINL